MTELKVNLDQFDTIVRIENRSQLVEFAKSIDRLSDFHEADSVVNAQVIGETLDNALGSSLNDGNELKLILTPRSQHGKLRTLVVINLATLLSIATGETS